jgi:hypothetical protein
MLSLISIELLQKLSLPQNSLQTPLLPDLDLMPHHQGWNLLHNGKYEQFHICQGFFEIFFVKVKIVSKT